MQNAACRMMVKKNAQSLRFLYLTMLQEFGKSQKKKNGRGSAPPCEMTDYSAVATSTTVFAMEENTL